MKKYTASFHILRVGTAITFLWIGVLIFRDPDMWGSFLLPWAAGVLPIPLREAMISTAILDILVGFFLLIDVYTWIAALLATAHLVIVLSVVGINGATVRDIGLLAGSLSIAATVWPSRFAFWKKKK